MIAVIDYGMGNLRSVSKALERMGAAVQVTSDPREIARAEKCVLPGVGAFGAAMEELSRRGLVEPVKAAIAAGTPFLGVCLGLQLLFERSEEQAGVPGLGVLPGVVKRFDVDSSLKIPHMGWNRLLTARAGCPLLRGVPEQSFVYFVHSYYAAPADRAVVAADAEYGGPFAAMVWRERLFATQFHPEKSQTVGLRMLENFVTL